MSRQKIGIIGVGQIFEAAHYKNLIRYNHLEIHAVVDASIERAKFISEKYNIPYYFSSAAEMFEKCKLDLVSVCVPNKFHYENVMLSLKNNCHVFCEKPPSINAGEAKDMMDLSQQNKLVLAYNFHYRQSQNVAFIKNQINNHYFGDIYNVKVKALRRRGVPGWGNFINKGLQGGGALIDLGVHMLDVALYLLNYAEISSVFASTYTKIGNRKSNGTLGSWEPEKFQVEDSAFAFIKFVNGTSLNVETSFALNIKEKSCMNVLLRGEEAGASVFPLELYSDMSDELVDISVPFLAEEDNHAKSIDNFIKACNNEKSLIVNGYEGYRIQTIIDAVYKSAETGDVVKL